VPGADDVQRGTGRGTAGGVGTAGGGGIGFADEAQSGVVAQGGAE
jgi:hypothetical protein